MYGRKKKVFRRSFRKRGGKFRRSFGRKRSSGFRGAGKLGRGFRKFKWGKGRRSFKRFNRAYRKNKDFKKKTDWTINKVMDNLYPWKKYTNVERNRVGSLQNRGVTTFFEIGTIFNINRLWSNVLLDYPFGNTTRIRDGVQVKEMYLSANVKNNSTVDYWVDAYFMEPRFDSNLSPPQNLDAALAYEGLFNQGVQTTVTNYPYGITFYDLPHMTATYKIKRKRMLLKVGKQIVFKLHPKKIEGNVHNSGILIGNGLTYSSRYTRILYLVFHGAIGHERGLDTNLNVTRTEVTGIDIERFDHYCVRMVKEPSDLIEGNTTRYNNPTVPDIAETVIGVPNGAYVATARGNP